MKSLTIRIFFPRACKKTRLPIQNYIEPLFVTKDTCGKPHHIFLPFEDMQQLLFLVENQICCQRKVVVSGQEVMANYEGYSDDERRISTTDEPILTREETAPQEIPNFVYERRLGRHWRLTGRHLWRNPLA